MSRKFGPDLLVQQCVDRVEEFVTKLNFYASQPPYDKESPIEILLSNALYCHTVYVQDEWPWRVRYVGEDGLDAVKARPDFRDLLIVQRQLQLPDWRVDFMIHAYADWHREPDGGIEGWRRLIVECDGHSFHERTKEQAAKDRSRDRWAISNGYEIFRFTGSEIWRDPLGCAEQVIQWANRGV